MSLGELESCGNHKRNRSAMVDDSSMRIDRVGRSVVLGSPVLGSESLGASADTNCQYVHGDKVIRFAAAERVVGRGRTVDIAV